MQFKSLKIRENQLSRFFFSSTLAQQQELEEES